MYAKTFALKGNICYTDLSRALIVHEDSYLVCENHVCAGIFKTLPERFRGIPCTDYGNALIIPGLIDLHLHAPQYTFRAAGMDMELLDWLNTYTFPEEARYQDPAYAREAYSIFAEDLKYSATTRACMFATIHVEATEILMDLMEETGLKTYVGKVNMDRNSSPDLQEADPISSAADTARWLCDIDGRYRNVKPILTPRFTPSCSDELMKLLGIIQREQDLPVQSHLSENYAEMTWVQKLCPNTRFYGEAYDQFGLFGGNAPTIMAHCVHCPDEEIALMKKRGVFIAHCAESNTNLASGIAPARRYLEEGLHMGLGSDIAGGTQNSILFSMAQAIQASKLRWRLVDDSLPPLSLEDAFYLATCGGGEFFGKVGSFQEGYEFDAVVLDDKRLRTPKKLTIRNRLERLTYLSDDREVASKYVAGHKIF